VLLKPYTFNMESAHSTVQSVTKEFFKKGSDPAAKLMKVSAKGQVTWMVLIKLRGNFKP
jgi:hypothetical protein